ncbi:MAG: hypothetical protein AAF480_11825 [Actinomycetota bacterium]
MQRRATVGLLVVLVAVVVARFAFADDTDEPPEGAIRAVTCERAEQGAADLAVDLGVLSIEDLRGVQPDADGALHFEAVVSSRTGDVGVVILQAGADGVPLRLRADGSGAVEATASALITLERCAEPARYELVLDLTAPACVFLVASDPTEGAFRQLPVSLGAPCDSVAPPD